MTAYQMCIANVARIIRSATAHENTESNTPNAFDFALGIAAGFCKDQQEVVLDIINFKEAE